jgi:hypothetical protein
MMYKILATIDAHRDKASESALRQGALSNNDKAFEKFLGQQGVLVRTRCVERAEGGAYCRTESGKELQKYLDWGLKFDDHTQGEFYK